METLQVTDLCAVWSALQDTFSKNAKQTVEPKAAGVLIGQRRRLSKGDVMQANLLYNCPSNTCSYSSQCREC